MLASDPYLSHMVAAEVQTATVKDINVGGILGASTPKSARISAASQTTASAFPLTLVTVMVVLFHTAPLVHFATI